MWLGWFLVCVEERYLLEWSIASNHDCFIYSTCGMDVPVRPPSNICYCNMRVISTNRQLTLYLQELLPGISGLGPVGWAMQIYSRLVVYWGRIFRFVFGLRVRARGTTSVSLTNSGPAPETILATLTINECLFTLIWNVSEVLSDAVFAISHDFPGANFRVGL